ncbi:MAG: hypothetical protein JOZ72_04800 [Alphaproteobacteria bacterium]|nr:hypothetical protein [Alphaproteobacteria bacterium]
MKRIALAALAAVILPVAAAQADPFAVAYGNTVTQTLPDGRKTTIYINADKTWERHNTDGTTVKGTYSWKDATHACFVMTDPPPPGNAQADCNEIKGDHKVGDTWTETMPDGKTSITMAITAGR